MWLRKKKTFHDKELIFAANNEMKWYNETWEDKRIQRIAVTVVAVVVSALQACDFDLCLRIS